MIFKTKTEQEFEKRLENTVGVENIEFKKRFDNDTTYFAANVQLAGIDLWGLHEEFNFNVVSSYHIPSEDKLRICFTVK